MRWPEGSLFNSYYTEVLGRVLLLSLNCSTLNLIHTYIHTYLILWVLSKEVSSTIFLSLWYDSSWEWTLVAWVIGKHYIYIYIIIKSGWLPGVPWLFLTIHPYYPFLLVSPDIYIYIYIFGLHESFDIFLIWNQLYILYRIFLFSLDYYFFI